MRQTILSIILFLCGINVAWSQSVSADSVRIERNGKYLSVDMTLSLSGLAVESNRAVLLTPRLSNGMDSIDLPSVGVYGRERYIHYKRKNGKNMLGGSDWMSYKARKAPDLIAYHTIVTYQDWMDGAALILHKEDYGCCNTVLAEQYRLIEKYEAIKPQREYAEYASKLSERETRTIRGSATVTFPVNETTICPEYLDNQKELARICATIDSIRNDTTVVIVSVWLKGYASPEGKYEHNRELAIGRTEALRNYLRQLYDFEDGVISIDYEPENWEGVRRYVESSDLEHRKEILEIIDDCSIDLDTNEMRIRKAYHKEYKRMIDDCYPRLRRTVYVVELRVKNEE
ncbi:MAG: DUF3868 domain-containing protein [Prevotella sp.]|nr:DUF3868 domain-containing protein [Prevotella sp.]